MGKITVKKNGKKQTKLKRSLPAQSQQQKHQNQAQNTLKANNKRTRTTSLSGVFIAHLEHKPHSASAPPPPNLNKELL